MIDSLFAFIGEGCADVWSTESIFITVNSEVIKCLSNPFSKTYGVRPSFAKPELTPSVFQATDAGSNGLSTTISHSFE